MGKKEPIMEITLNGEFVYGAVFTKRKLDLLTYFADLLVDIDFPLTAPKKETKNV